MREVINAIFDLNRSGCQWDMLSHDFPAKNTVYDHYKQWKADSTWLSILDTLRRQVRTAGGHDPSLGVSNIDSQTVKATEIVKGRGFDGGKLSSGRKRYFIVDKLGPLLVVLVSLASADDRTFACEVLGRLTTELRSRLKSLWADGKYRIHRLNAWLLKKKVGYAIDVVGRPAGSVGFVEQLQRYGVERTFDWLGG